MNAVDPAEQNLEMLSTIARSIGHLRETLVFVGGCATGLLVTNVRAQPFCRWRRGEISVDLMPSSEGILGFHNRWYGLAVETATQYVLPDGTKIKLVTTPVFVATKFEAFKDRGKGDYLASHDLEDIITIVDGRGDFLNEICRGPEELSRYLSGEFATLLADRNFLDALPGHLSADSSSQRRIGQLMTRLRDLAALSRDD
ncbi:MAG: hypothetical protein ACKVQK_20110 [Burkholderiales bacterium]